jgi:hypothetical protein
MTHSLKPPGSKWVNLYRYTEAVALTVNPKTQISLIEKGFLHAAQTCISRLGRAVQAVDSP